MRRAFAGPATQFFWRHPLVCRRFDAAHLVGEIQVTKSFKNFNCGNLIETFL
jgi:hypothetical protein